MKEKKKVTEDHLFRISEIEKGCVNSVFKLEKYRDEYIILFRLEKTLQGDRFDPIEAYQVSSSPLSPILDICLGWNTRKEHDND